MRPPFATRASELWAKVSTEDAFFLVADPQGKVIASLGASVPIRPNEEFPEVQAARARFPEQVPGFVQRSGELFQVVVTPVYVQSGHGAGLLDVLVAGYRVDSAVARRLKEETGGSDFVFVTGRQVVTSTLPARLPRMRLRSDTARPGSNDDYLSLRHTAVGRSRRAHRAVVHPALL